MVMLIEGFEVSRLVELKQMKTVQKLILAMLRLLVVQLGAIQKGMQVFQRVM